MKHGPCSPYGPCSLWRILPMSTKAPKAPKALKAPKAHTTHAACGLWPAICALCPATCGLWHGSWPVLLLVAHGMGPRLRITVHRMRCPDD